MKKKKLEHKLSLKIRDLSLLTGKNSEQMKAGKAALVTNLMTTAACCPPTHTEFCPTNFTDCSIVRCQA